MVKAATEKRIKNLEAEQAYIKIFIKCCSTHLWQTTDSEISGTEGTGNLFKRKNIIKYPTTLYMQEKCSR